MPEGLEVEIWRAAAQPLVGRTVTDLWVDERVAPVELGSIGAGAVITSVERRGKVLLVDLDRGATIGFHFGMTGRLVLDGTAPIERLEYASAADRSEWDRCRIWTSAAVPALRMNDPRRLGRVSLDPDLSRLGPEALTLSAEQLEVELRGRSAPVKSLLLDQSVVAGLGNLCADEVLFVAGLDPHRGADTLVDHERAALAEACRTRLPQMLDLGGSTHGTLDPETRAGPGRCPGDGALLRRDKIGGRTAVWCPEHQR